MQAARQSLHGEQWRPYRPQPAVGQTATAAPPLSYITAVVYVYINNIPIPKTEWCAARIVQRVCKCRRSRRRSYYYLKKHKSNDGEKKSTLVSRRRRRDCEIHAVSSSGRPPDWPGPVDPTTTEWQRTRDDGDNGRWQPRRRGLLIELCRRRLANVRFLHTLFYYINII